MANSLTPNTLIIITMAGEGSRFREAGYGVPKYEIEVKGRTLFEWSQTSLRQFIEGGNKFLFIALGRDNAREFIADACRSLGIVNFEILELDGKTDGQASTVLAGEKLIKNVDAPVLIFNIDTFVEPDKIVFEDIRGDGWIPFFRTSGSHWSFVKTDDFGRVTEIKEKQRISDQATIGIYWFSSFRLFKEAVSVYYSKHGETHKEKYIAPAYGYLLSRGQEVWAHEVEPNAVHALGTPEELIEFSRA